MWWLFHKYIQNQVHTGLILLGCVKIWHFYHSLHCLALYFFSGHSVYILNFFFILRYISMLCWEADVSRGRRSKDYLHLQLSVAVDVGTDIDSCDEISHLKDWSPVSIQTQSLTLASSQSWLTEHSYWLALAFVVAWKRKRLRFLRFSFTQRTQRKRLRLNGNRAWVSEGSTLLLLLLACLKGAGYVAIIKGNETESCVIVSLLLTVFYRLLLNL